MDISQYAALHPRQPANLRALLADAQAQKKPLSGMFSGLDSTQVAKLVANVGFDVVAIDAEHTPYGPAKVAELIYIWNFGSQQKTIPIVRIPHLESEILPYALDAGAGGIILPHTETADQARKLVAACNFPGKGHRSFPPLALIYPYHHATPEGMSTLEYLNRNVAPIVQIESVKGIENIEEILSVLGVGGVMIGWGDLRIDMGTGGIGPAGMNIWADEQFVQMMQKVKEVTTRLKVPLVMVPSFNPAELPLALDLDPALVWTSVDGFTLVQGMAGALQGFKTAVEAYQKAKKQPNGVVVNGAE